jgi:hypothetical protein
MPSINLLEPRTPLGGVTQHLGDMVEKLAYRLPLSLAETRANSLVDALDFLGFGALLVATSGKVLRINRSAQAYVGRGLILVHGRLRAQARDAESGLQQLITSVIGRAPMRPSQSVITIPRSEGCRLIIYAANFASQGDPSCCALLILIDPDKERMLGDGVLRRVYSLTPSEERIALAIAQGLQVKKIARTYKPTTYRKAT